MKQRSHDEEMLTSELSSLKAEMNKLSAPDSVEAKVLQAFRARKVVPIRFKRSTRVTGSLQLRPRC